jgi:glycosyltransferase involved in cell wall biosynthesis
MDPKVTVAMPTYNRSGLLSAALASALAQDYDDFGVMVLDNASTDDTEAVVQSFDDPRVTYVRNDTNMGCTGNLNRAIELNTSPYLNILMDDDLLLPGFLSESVKMLDEHQEASFSFTAAKYVNVDRVPLAGRHSRDVPAGVIDGLDYLELHLNVRECWIEPSTVMMRSAAVTTGAFDSPHSRHSDDLNLWLRLAARSPIVHNPNELVEVRVHDGQLSEAAFRSEGYGHYGTIAERIDALAYLLQSARADNPSYRRWLADRLRSLHRSQSTQLYRLIPDLYYPQAERLRMAEVDIMRLVPPGQPFILVDQSELGSDLKTDRPTVPFLEHQGQYYGLPPNDETAIRELERLRHGGCGFIVFAWPAFWWLDYYSSFRDYLNEHFVCRLANSRLIAFDLEK